MKLIPGGTFQMGSEARSNTQPVHSVTVSSFFMDSTEVTQGEYEQAMGVNPAHFTGDPTRPVENETWYDAVLFCNARSRQAGLDSVYRYDSAEGLRGNGCSNLAGLVIDYTSNGYRLPTEAEWEYACRSGTTSVFHWGDGTDSATAARYAWYAATSLLSTHPVASLQANGFGLYDMSGNVYEWCNDFYGSYGADAQTDPTGPADGSSRISRGGSWYEGIDQQGAATRFSYYPQYTISYFNQGFRCVRAKR
jgi:formylglycine-generating enzyme required for sulfatase activity